MNAAYRRSLMSPAERMAERAKRLADIESAHALRIAADPTTPFRELLKLANALEIGSRRRSEHHELLRRCFVLHAWAHLRIARFMGEKRFFGKTGIPFSHGNYCEARRALAAARAHRHIAASARKVEQLDAEAGQ